MKVKHGYWSGNECIQLFAYFETEEILNPDARDKFRKGGWSLHKKGRIRLKDMTL